MFSYACIFALKRREIFIIIVNISGVLFLYDLSDNFSSTKTSNHINISFKNSFYLKKKRNKSRKKEP